MEELEAGDAMIPIPEVTVLPEKQSFSGDLEPAPGDNQLTFNEVGTTLYPRPFPALRSFLLQGSS